jgi:hypothetical protein
VPVTGEAVLIAWEPSKFPEVVVSSLLLYDEGIWKEIGALVEFRTSRLLKVIQEEITGDRSLDGLPSKQAIVRQRADAWVQRVYDSCCDVYVQLGKTISPDFDRVVWAYCIEPFILKDVESADSAGSQGLLELLRYATACPREDWCSPRVGNKGWCYGVRFDLFEAWQKKLLHLTTLTRVEAAAAAMAQYNAAETRARQLVGGLPTTTPTLAEQSRSPTEAHRKQPAPSGLPAAAQIANKETHEESFKSLASTQDGCSAVKDAALPQPPTSPLRSDSTQEPGSDPKMTSVSNLAAADHIDEELHKEKHCPLPPRQFDYAYLMDAAHLTELQRRCYSLHHEYQLPVVEIAQRLDRDRKTVQEHIDSADRKITIAATKDHKLRRKARSGME